MTPDLKNVQGLLYRLIVAPSGVADGLQAESDLPPGGLDAIVRGYGHLSAIERVDIYADMYFYRLLDCLKEDYPATLAVVGATNFHNLITGYLIAHPPSHPSVLYAGRHLAAFLDSHPLRAEWPFVADLARLERALIEVFHGPDASVLRADELRLVAPADWPMLVLKAHPALQLLPVRWKVTEVVRAIEEKRDWQTPEHAQCNVLVWRRNNQCYYRDVSGVELPAIRALRDGLSFAALCELIEAAAPERDPAAHLSELLERWLADSILTIPSSARAD